MRNSFFYGETLDDVMRSIAEEILINGIQISPTKGECMELMGVVLEIENPRARFSRTETKGKPFSGLGELCWYLAETNELDFISYYLSKYKNFADGNIIYGGYGPRLFNWKGINQVSQTINLLRNRPSSRKAVIQLFEADDLIEDHNDVPCTCTLQFMIRNEKLHMITSMRSNDIILGLPHDVFSFTMLQEIIARSLSIEIGSYKHFVGSMHIYNKDVEKAQAFLQEGWQPTNLAMPPMPHEDPWLSVVHLIKAEKKIRLTGYISDEEINQTHPYWADLIRLLQIYRYNKYNNVAGVQQCRAQMSSKIYNTFIDKMIDKV